MEPVYGVQLLDDLHAYFPDILYEPERFGSVQDLLGYIREQAQEHFNLYNRAQRMHVAARASPAAAAAAPTSAATATPAAPAAPSSASPAAAPSPAAAAAAPQRTTGRGAGVAAPPPPFRMQQTPLYTSFYQESSGISNSFRFQPAGRSTIPSLLFDFGADRDDSGSQLINSLLGLALMGGGAAAGAPANFMDPVTVRPTADQIRHATERIVLEEALEENCAICQDRMEAQNATRKIHACGHSFHTECIDTWFERSVSCPVCRHDIRVEQSHARVEEEEGDE